MRVAVRNGNVEQAIRLLKRKINDSGKLLDYREKERYTSKSERKQRKRASAVAREKKRVEKLNKKFLSRK